MQAAASSSDGDDTPLAMLPPTAKRAATAGAAQLSPSLHPGQPQTTPTAASTANPPHTTSKTMPGVTVTTDRSTGIRIQAKAGQYYGQGVDTDMQASCTPAAVDEASAEEQQAVLQVAPVLPMAQPTSSPTMQSGNVPDAVLVRPAVDSHPDAPGGLVSDSESGSQGASPDAMQTDDPQLCSPDAGRSAGATLQQAPVATAAFPVATQIDDAQLHSPGNVCCPAAAIQLASDAAATSPHAMQSESLQPSHPSNDHSPAAALQLAPKTAAVVSQLFAIAIPSNASQQDQTSGIHLQADTAARSQSQSFAAANVPEPAADISMQQHEASQVLHPVAAAAAPVNAPVSPASMAEPHAGMLSGAHASVPHAVPLQGASAATTEQAHGQLSVPSTVTGPNGPAASGTQVHMPQPGPAHGAQQAEATLPTSGMTACPAPASAMAKPGNSNSVYNMMFPPQFALQLQQQRAGTDRRVDSTASLVQAEAEAARLRAVLANSSRSVSSLSNDHDDATAALLTTKPELAAGDMLPQHASPHAKLTSRDQVQGTSAVPAVDVQADESQQHAVSISDAIIPDR